jgi:transposase-like protein
VTKRNRSNSAKALMERLRDQRWTAEEAGRVLALWRESGATLAEFSRRHEVTAQRIAWWRDRLDLHESRGGESARSPAIATTSVADFIPALLRPAAGGGGEGLVTVRIGRDIAVEIADPALVPAEWISVLITRCADKTP